MKYINYQFSILLSISLFFIGCSDDVKKIEKQNIVAAEVNIDESQLTENQKHDFSFNIIEVNENQFGYDILIDGQPYIHQPHIPAIAGNKGFSSKEKAETAVNYIIHKLNNNIIPPTISLAELDSLGVLD